MSFLPTALCTDHSKKHEVLLYLPENGRKMITVNISICKKTTASLTNFTVDTVLYNTTALWEYGLTDGYKFLL